MANKLRRIKVNELALVSRGFHPVNPECKTEIFKSEKEDTEMSVKELLQKALGQLEAAPPPAAEPAAPAAEPTVAAPAAAPPALAAEENVTKAVAASEERIAKAVAEVIQPVAALVKGIDTRLAVVEKSVPATQRIEVTDLRKAEKFPEFNAFLRSRAGLTAGQRLTKAGIDAITTASFTYGMTTEEASAFITNVVDQSALLKRIRNIQLNAHQTKIDKLGLGGKVLRKQAEATDPGLTVSISTGQIVFNPKDFIAVVQIGDDAIQDNIEGEGLVQTLLGMVGRAAANELEEALLMADADVADDYILDIFDGIYTRAIAQGSGAHITLATGDADRYWPGTDQVKATKLLKTLPSKYRADKSQLAWILHPDLYLDYMDTLAGRESGLGDQSVVGMQDVPLRGIANVQVPLLPTNLTVGQATDGTFVLLTLLKNLIFGWRKYVKIEPERKPTLGATNWVLTFRGDCNVEEMDAVAIYKDAKVKA